MDFPIRTHQFFTYLKYPERPWLWFTVLLFCFRSNSEKDATASERSRIQRTWKASCSERTHGTAWVAFTITRWTYKHGW